MALILHISADYPDKFSARKTLAVRNLVQGSPEFDHCVYSINRQDGFGGIREVGRDGNVTTLAYRAPPYGLFLETFLSRLADWIAADVRSGGMQVDLLHAHKLTIEGLVARRLSRLLGCPFICTVRGNTDQRYLRIKREKRAAYRDVITHVSHLLPVTPWCDRYVAGKFNLDTTPRTVLPTISGIDRVVPPDLAGRRFVTVFHLDSWKMKGMPRLLAAIAALRAEGAEIELDIIGGGTEVATRALEKEIARHRLQGAVRMAGPIAHDQLPEVLNRYAAFVLPTLRETFGMVYVEALFAGLPILYSQDRGIDGYFDGLGVGLRCNPVSATSIRQGLLALDARCPEMKHNVARIQKNGVLDRFRTRTICRDYTAVVRNVLEERSIRQNL